jgi:GDP-4-dehydro-6-deoxy-D-mannose reductase
MTRLDGSVALVTGVSGFVGPHLVRALRGCGVRVHGLGSEPPWEALELESWHPADITRLDSLEAAFRTVTPHLVIHLAGQSSAARSFEEPVETFRANALGTWNVLEAVRRTARGARVLIVGSGEVYGPQPEGSRVREQAPLRPVSPYALSKAAADRFAEAAAVAGLDVVRTRSFAHAGPGQAPLFAIPSWAQQIAAIESGGVEPSIRVGNLEVTRDLTDVRDVAQGYIALLEHGSCGAAYNVCRGAGVRLSALIQQLTQRARVPVRVEVDPERVRPADVPYLVGDPTAIERDTGWRATMPLERTLDEVLDEWRQRRRAVGEGGGRVSGKPS